jgi:steroid 5-alpha reductase family enzyme
VIGAHEEDGRYRRLRRHWVDRANAWFLVFFESQTLLVVLFSVPFLVLLENPEPRFGALEIAGVALWLVSIAGEMSADRQLARFRADPANRGKTCRVGLWWTSRHPNYFFEWLHWWSYVLMGVGAPYGWLTLVGPVVMLFFLLKVTGIPYTEMRALEHRPDYAEYQRTTSAFIPWFPRPPREPGRESAAGTP